MKYYVKSIIKLLIVVFIQLLMVDFSFANPVPVFCLAGWHKCCDAKANSSIIHEHDPDTNATLKVYDCRGSSIVEHDPDTNATLKVYD